VETIRFLRATGLNGNEGFVLWAGKTELPSAFRFIRAVIPTQTALKTDTGLLVTVEGTELFRINKFLHQQGETLAGQVHTHPTDAYHSDTDDTYPLVTLVGALSVVIPHFARQAPVDMDEWAWYRLSEAGSWDWIDNETAIEIV
jgi:hypothetical protein